jgi:hypothetical protein
MKKRFVIKAISAALWVVIFTMTNINTLDATATLTAESTNTPLKVQAGLGNGTIAIQAFSPQQVDVELGEVLPDIIQHLYQNRILSPLY